MAPSWEMLFSKLFKIYLLSFFRKNYLKYLRCKMNDFQGVNCFCCYCCYDKYYLLTLKTKVITGKSAYRWCWNELWCGFDEHVLCLLNEPKVNLMHVLQYRLYLPSLIYQLPVCFYVCCTCAHSAQSERNWFWTLGIWWVNVSVALQKHLTLLIRLKFSIKLILFLSFADLSAVSEF